MGEAFPEALSSSLTMYLAGCFCRSTPDGTSESWRRIKKARCLLCTSHVGGVCIDGAIYFFDHGLIPCRNFRIISSWEGSTYLPAERFYNIMELEGKLAVVDRSRANMGEMALRNLQSSKMEEWVKHTIDFPRMNLETYFLSCFCSSTADGEIAFITKSSLNTTKIFFYDSKKKSCRGIEIVELAEQVEIIDMCSHVDNLLSCIYC
ncbi:putative F-box protein At1g47790 [Lycium barbarum]|uniref:putative F-box protein At1g47790 n=1 Tax=Lycium barbarum TaxID=112863 RepID=UPI00293F212F|nr:putative F-box protein At1g47790 [Lycium barbarum]